MLYILYQIRIDQDKLWYLLIVNNFELNEYNIFEF